MYTRRKTIATEKAEAKAEAKAAAAAAEAAAAEALENAESNGIMQKILEGTMVPKTENQLLRATELGDRTNIVPNFKGEFGDVLNSQASSKHARMQNKPLKDALTNIRKMLYKMEIMLIDKNLTGNLEDVEERLIQTFVKLSQKVPDASAPAADAPIVVPPDTTANPAAADDTNPIVDPDDHGPIGEEAREISGERWKAQKVMADAAAEDAAAKAKAALGSAGEKETKLGT